MTARLPSTTGARGVKTQRRQCQTHLASFLQRLVDADEAEVVLYVAVAVRVVGRDDGAELGVTAAVVARHRAHRHRVDDEAFLLRQQVRVGRRRRTAVEFVAALTWTCLNFRSHGNVRQTVLARSVAVIRFDVIT